MSFAFFWLAIVSFANGNHFLAFFFAVSCVASSSGRRR